MTKSNKFVMPTHSRFIITASNFNSFDDENDTQLFLVKEDGTKIPFDTDGCCSTELKTKNGHLDEEIYVEGYCNSSENNKEKNNDQ